MKERIIRLMVRVSFWLIKTSIRWCSSAGCDRRK